MLDYNSSFTIFQFQPALMVSQTTYDSTGCFGLIHLIGDMAFTVTEAHTLQLDNSSVHPFYFQKVNFPITE